MAVQTISREHRIYLAIWRKVGLMEDDLEIKLSSHTEAISMRMGMYRAIRPYRAEELIDEELLAVAETHAINVSPGSSVMTIKRKVGLSAAEGLMASLGIDETDLITTEEKSLQNRLETLIESDPTPYNPFYDREKL